MPVIFISKRLCQWYLSQTIMPVILILSQKIMPVIFIAVVESICWIHEENNLRETHLKLANLNIWSELVGTANIILSYKWFRQLYACERRMQIELLPVYCYEQTSCVSIDGNLYPFCCDQSWALNTFFVFKY